MTIARIYIEGQPWEIMGNIADSFLGYTNEAMPTRGNRNYIKTTAKTKTLKIDNIMVNPAEQQAFEDYFSSCGTKRFPLTVVTGEGCDEDEFSQEVIYRQAALEGDPEYSIFDNTITGFQVSYEEKVRV